MVLKGAVLADQPTEITLVDSMVDMLEAIAEYNASDGAIGYTVYYYLTNMEDDKFIIPKHLNLTELNRTRQQ